MSDPSGKEIAQLLRHEVSSKQWLKPKPCVKVKAAKPSVNLTLDQVFGKQVAASRAAVVEQAPVTPNIRPTFGFNSPADAESSPLMPPPCEHPEPVREDFREDTSQMPQMPMMLCEEIADPDPNVHVRPQQSSHEQSSPLSVPPGQPSPALSSATEVAEPKLPAGLDGRSPAVVGSVNDAFSWTSDFFDRANKARWADGSVDW